MRALQLPLYTFFFLDVFVIVCVCVCVRALQLPLYTRTHEHTRARAHTHRVCFVSFGRRDGLIIQHVKLAQVKRSIGPRVRMRGQRIAGECQYREILDSAEVLDIAERRQAVVRELHGVQAPMLALEF